MFEFCANFLQTKNENKPEKTKVFFWPLELGKFVSLLVTYDLQVKV